MLSLVATCRRVATRPVCGTQNPAARRGNYQRPKPTFRSFCESRIIHQKEEEDEDDIRAFKVSEETLKKLDGLSEEELLKKKSLVAVTANVADGKSVVCYGGGKLGDLSFSPAVTDMKVHRWYQDVEVKEVPDNDTWTVTLDGRYLFRRQLLTTRTIITRTEKGLYLPTKEVAMLVASDWEAQDGIVSYAKLPLVVLSFLFLFFRCKWLAKQLMTLQLLRNIITKK